MGEGSPTDLDTPGAALEVAQNGAAPLKPEEPPAKKRLTRQEMKDAAEVKESIAGEPVARHYVQGHHHALVEMTPRVFAQLEERHKEESHFANMA